MAGLEGPDTSNRAARCAQAHTGVSDNARCAQAHTGVSDNARCAQAHTGVSDNARYNTLKYALTILETVYLAVLLYLFLSLGASAALADQLGLWGFGNLIMPVYLLIISLAYYVLSFPLTVSRTWLLEKHFNLSRQSFSSWMSDQVKAGVISYVIVLALIAAFYGALEYFASLWWIVTAAVWIFFSFILAKLTPLIVIPLFFKYKAIPDGELRQRILALARKMRVRLLDVYEIDFSRKTLKANAAFVGTGSSRRVILADTLKDKYSADEIEVVLAHEFAHCKLRHLTKLILVNSVVTLVLLYIIFKTSGPALEMAGLSALTDPAALPLLFLYFLLFGIVTAPVGNFISRVFERQADKMALAVTGNPGAFVSMMNKLAGQNLADCAPHPFIKFFFFDHPPIDERIAAAS